MHSTFSKGVNLTWFINFLFHHTVIYRCDYDGPAEVQEAIYQKLISMEYRPYDVGAFLYLAFRYLAFRLFGKDLPRKNKWSSHHADICVELVKVMELAGYEFPDLDIVNPEELYFLLKDQKHGNISNN